MMELIIPRARVPAIERLLRRVARAAARAGQDPPTWELSPAPEARGPAGLVYQRQLVAITWTAPRLQGARILASREHLPDGGVLIRAWGQEPLPDWAYSRGPECDHCRTRRRRRWTEVLVTEAGECRLVGRSCLQAAGFVAAGADALAAYLEMLASLESRAREPGDWIEAPLIGENTTGIDLGWYLPRVAAAVRRIGWRSRSAAYAAGGQATADRALDREEGADIGPYVTEADRELAARVLDWARQVDPAGNEYQWNLRELARAGWAREAHLGIVAAAVPAYERAHRAANTGYVGTVGEQVTVSATLRARRRVEGLYGSSIMYRFEDSGGHQLVWFCSGREPAGLDVGVTGELRGRVKRHDERHGSTVLTRCRWRGEQGVEG